MVTKKFTAGRCNYCDAPATVSFQHSSWVSKMGHRRAITVTHRTCDEHEGCVNWQSNLQLHPDAIVCRKPSP